MEAILWILLALGTALCIRAIVRAERLRPKDTMTSMLASLLIGAQLAIAATVLGLRWWLGKSATDAALVIGAAVLAVLAGWLARPTRGTWEAGEAPASLGRAVLTTSASRD